MRFLLIALLLGLALAASYPRLPSKVYYRAHITPEDDKFSSYEYEVRF